MQKLVFASWFLMQKLLLQDGVLLMQKLVFVDAKTSLIDAETTFFTSIAPHFPSHHHDLTLPLSTL
jgi:hypothetical protein